MGLIRTASGFLTRRAWLTVGLRIFCMLLLWLACLSLHGGFRVRGLSSATWGMSDAPASDGAGHLGCEASSIPCDGILPDGRDNDPFLVFLSLRNACAPAFFPFNRSDHGLSATGTSRVGVSPRDIRPPHLHIIARSAQLLC